jgi:branched-chain amino acid transport system substrate-binding protein
MKNIFILAVALLSILLACAQANAEVPIKIGVSLSSTGKYAELGNMSLRAYKLWETDINKKGGLLGRQVQVIIQDDKSSPDLAKDIYEQLINKEKVDLVFAPISSEITEAVVGVTEKYGYPLLLSGSSADSLFNQGYKNLFGILSPAAKHTTEFLELLANNNLTSIALISSDDNFSKGAAAGAKEWIKRFGLNMVYFEETNKEANFEQAVIRAKSSKAQVLMVCGHYVESLQIRAALKHIGWYPKAYYATLGPLFPKYYDTLKEDANHTFSSSQWEPTSPFPGTKEFNQAFQDMFHVSPPYQAAASYAAGQILEIAVKKAKRVDRDAIRATLASLDAMTIMGRYGVDEKGRQIRHFAVVVQWQNGKKETVAPKEFKSANPIWHK